MVSLCTASNAMPAAVIMSRTPSAKAARFSARPWPYGCSVSAGFRAVRTATSVNPLAARSSSECTASLMIPRLPVSSPTTSLPTTMAAPMKTEISATSSGLRPSAFMSTTLVGRFWAPPETAGPLPEHRRRREELLLRAQRDHEVAFLQEQVGGRVGVQRAIAAAHCEHLRRVRAHQTRACDRLTHRRHPRLHQHLLDRDLRLAVMKAVHDVHERRPHGELGHTVPGHLIRGDHAVGAGQLQAADRFGPPGSGDQVEVWLERPRGKNDVDGALVGVDGRDEASRALDARKLEDVFAGSVALDVEPVLVAQPQHRVLGLVDDGVRDVVRPELGDDLCPDAAVAADDGVIPELIQGSLHLSLSPAVDEAVVGEGLGEDAV